MNCNQIQPLFMDFLYDEISDDDRQMVQAHLSECDSCQRELDSLRKTSQLLQQWEEVDPDFNVVMVTEKVSWFGRLKGWVTKLLPRPKKIVYGLAYSLVGVLLVLAVANTEIVYRQGEFNVRMGLFSKPTPLQTTDNLATQQLLEQLQKDNYILMNSLIQQSETRQRKEIASALIQLRQDVERQRVEDLSLVGFGLDNVEKNTVRQMRKTDNSLNELIRLINAQPR